jgi:hypothetical protein
MNLLAKAAGSHLILHYFKVFIRFKLKVIQTQLL